MVYYKSAIIQIVTPLAVVTGIAGDEIAIYDL